MTSGSPNRSRTSPAYKPSNETLTPAATAITTLQTAFSASDHATISTITKDAARSGDISTLQEALGLGAKPQDYVNQALSVPSGSPDAYTCLLDAGLDVNYRFPSYTGNALIAASKHGLIEVVRMLLARGADPNLKGVGYGGPERLDALACAAACSQREDGVEVMRLLLGAGAEVEGSGALQVAAKWGHLERVRILVEEVGVGLEDVNARVGGSAVSLAREHGRVEVVEYLKEHGAAD